MGAAGGGGVLVFSHTNKSLSFFRLTETFGLSDTEPNLWMAPWWLVAVQLTPPPPLTCSSTVAAAVVAIHPLHLSYDGSGQLLDDVVLSFVLIAFECLVQRLLFTVLQHRHPAGNTGNQIRTGPNRTADRDRLCAAYI